MTILLAAACAAKIVTALAGALRDHYVFPEAGKRMAIAVEAKRSSYERLDDAELADALTRDLKQITGDAHLRVAAPAPQQPAVPQPRPAADHDDGVRRVEVLPGKIGYLDLREFDRPDAPAREKVAAAFELLKDSDALIIDLRANGGGNPDMVALISAYVLDGPTLLAEMHHRETGVEPLRSPERPHNAPRSGIPLYLLTSHQTFSAGEGFAFILQHLGRAVVVGERTAGAAHAGREYPLACGFEATIPNTAVVLPGTLDDWEGGGVAPDVPAEAAKALDVAQALAAARLSHR